jgi:acetyl-CoA carboxylase carboxyltransferase component
MNYKFLKLHLEDAFYLSEIKDLIDNNTEISFYVPDNCEKIQRKTFDGFFTMITQIEGQTVAICYNDFRGFGSTFGVDNSKRVGAFLDFITDEEIPLIYLANSSGIRVQDSRKVFRNSFTLVAKIKKFAKNNLYVSASLGQTLGLSALLYSLADYRLALKEVCKFNLTGPEIFKMFFGTKVDFTEVCNGETMLLENQLVQDLTKDKSDLYKKLRKLFSQSSPELSSPVTNMGELERWIEGDSLELFSSFGKSVRVFIKETKNGKVGVFYNPFNNPNMISVIDVQKMRYGISLFEKLKLPILNFVDTAGGDPRISENNKNIARQLYDLASDIIDYPFYKRAIICGRCFGGASILSFPVFFGGEKTILIHGAKIGIMDNNIIKHLLTNAKPLLNIWEENKKEEFEDYSDYVDDGLTTPLMSISEAIATIEKDIKF